MITLVGLFCLLYAGFLAVRARIALRNNQLNLHKRANTNPKIAFLIPARYESAVIEGLLKSITMQTHLVSMQDVYVIVESLEDPTVKICKTYGANIILREHLELQRKGYALDEAIKQILPKYHYDLYFIFDADNRLAPDYVEEMLTICMQGYKMATGYRNAKNNNHNVISAVSALTFTMINTLGNKNRILHAGNIIFSGTGCFIDGSLIEQWQGWPFHSLTEDYEMSLYAILHNIPTFYNEKAFFYDEQPTAYAQTVDQRVRWIKGYFAARREYIPQMRKRNSASNDGSLVKEKIGVHPVIWALIGVVLLLLDNIVQIFRSPDLLLILGMLISVLLVVYFVLMFITIVMIKREKMHFTKRIALKAILFNPIYLITYVPCALKALFTRNVAWTRIEHGKKK